MPCFCVDKQGELQVSEKQTNQGLIVDNASFVAPQTPNRNAFSRHFVKLLKISTLTALRKPVLGICALATLWGSQALASIAQDFSHSTAAVNAEQCRQLLQGTQSNSGHGALDPGNIQVLNWNLKKGQQRGWQSDLELLAAKSQLVMIQEASLDPAMIRHGGPAKFLSFAPGYRSKNALTGVLTLSAVKPIGQCRFTATEPWLRTPKATGITEYALIGTTETLVVVNIHAINFTFGLKDYRHQLQQIRSALQGHTGPLILTGDFNSWRLRRQHLLQQLADDLELHTPKYGLDNRVKVFGLALDHIYIRGFSSHPVFSPSVTSSDHNPLVVRLGLGGGDS